MHQPTFAASAATKLAVVAIFALLIVAACSAPSAPAPAPADQATAEEDTATSSLTDNGLYRISFTSTLDPIAINQLHSWTVHVETADGQPVDDAQITVDGGMPAHGHGLPTQPQVTQALGNGDYLVEGVRFQMPGAWVMRFDVTADGQSDGVTFELALR
ncbi:MAG TPA: FixH family protein [Anaerolineae bacterium]|nr:FixH family protein [Anaerolineae bacterium]